MTKKLVRAIAAAVLAVSMIPTVAFAEEDTTMQLVEALEQGLEVYGEEGEAIRMVSIGNGSEYCRQVYELEDGNQLVMEFEDGVDGFPSFITTGTVSTIQPMATNGETVWKAYGNRYFTAKVTVTTDVGSVSLSLENHYTLSEDGIDERYGTADAVTSDGGSLGGIVEVDGVYITDSSARTVGASDVNMYAAFNILSNSGGIGAVSKTTKLSTAVGYIAHDYEGGRIQVKHSWSKS